MSYKLSSKWARKTSRSNNINKDKFNLVFIAYRMNYVYNYTRNGM